MLQPKRMVLNTLKISLWLSLTYIFGSRCKDGVVLVADSKIVFDNYNTEYRDKLFVYSDRIVMGSSGSVSLIDKFRNRALRAANALITSSEEDQTEAVDKFISHIEKETESLNVRYANNQPEFDVLIGIQTQNGAELLHVYPKGFAELVPKYRAIGHGEPFGSFFLKILWSANMKMKRGRRIRIFHHKIH